MTSSNAVHREQPEVHALPRTVTFDDLIRSNKRKSLVLIAAMIALVTILGSAITSAIAAYQGIDVESLWISAAAGAFAAVVAGVLASLWSFYGGANAILSMSKAREIPYKADPQLHNIVEELSIAAGQPKPKVYLIDDESPNAFATGRDPEHGVVAITRGLREQLSRDELAGVLAHEISHIRHYDIRFAMLMATLVGLVVFFSDAFLRVMWSGRFMGGGRRSSSARGDRGGGPIMIVIMVLALLFAIIAPTLALLIRFAVSRQREYLADAGAVELTRYPQGLVGALEKLGAAPQQLAVANRATAHLYIVNPLRQAHHGRGHEASSIFRTHPPLHERIARLQALYT